MLLEKVTIIECIFSNEINDLMNETVCVMILHSEGDWFNVKSVKTECFITI